MGNDKLKQFDIRDDFFRFKLHDCRTVVKCNDTATFKALISESNGYYLKPFNPNWSEQVIPLNEDCVLVGKYVGSSDFDSTFFSVEGAEESLIDIRGFFFRLLDAGVPSGFLFLA